jgi:hypothetical protein
MAVIAKGDIAKLQGGGHQVVLIAQSTATHSTPIRAPLRRSLFTTDRRRIDGAIEAGGCPRPG